MVFILFVVIPILYITFLNASFTLYAPRVFGCCLFAVSWVQSYGDVCSNVTGYTHNAVHSNERLRSFIILILMQSSQHNNSQYNLITHQHHKTHPYPPHTVTCQYYVFLARNTLEPVLQNSNLIALNSAANPTVSTSPSIYIFFVYYSQFLPSCGCYA